MLTEVFHSVVPSELLHPITQDSDTAALLPSITSQTTTISRISDIPLRRQVGFLHVLEQVITDLRTKIVRYIPLLLHVVLSLLKNVMLLEGSDAVADAEVEVEEQEGEAEDEVTATAAPRRIREVRMLCLRRFGAFLDAYAVQHPTELNLTSFIERFYTITSPSIPLLSQRSVQAVSPLMRVFVIMSRHIQLVPFLAESIVIPSVLHCLSAQSVSASVAMTVLAVVENLLNFRETEPDLIQPILKPHISQLLAELESSLSSSSSSLTYVILLFICVCVI